VGNSDASNAAVSYDQARAAILLSLESLANGLEASIGNTFSYHLVSQAQAALVERAYYFWLKAGGVGPQPGDPASVRSALYNQAAAARQLEAFLRVLKISIYEAATAAAQGFEKREISLPVMMLRGLVERTANAVLLADALLGLNLPAVKSETQNGPLLEVGDRIARALYGTRVNWPVLRHLDWRTAKKEEVAYVRKELTADMQVKGIMTAIDKLNRRVPGTRIAYDVLCEYLHPNVGDLYGATIRVRSSFDTYGTRHLAREIGLGPKDLSAAADLNVIMSKVLGICCEVMELLPAVIAELEAASLVANRMARKHGHRIRKRYRDYFQKNDLCPCLSGLKVRDCE
jgi:hypothetical protein